MDDWRATLMDFEVTEARSELDQGGNHVIKLDKG